ncbi:MAG: glycerol kinase GlpK [Castellaniella sp.]|uniref:glycerol kinase GlpK n=1 Tax=Castellaniella sp. TaxID=1955812 RepID=UPI003A839BBD
MTYLLALDQGTSSTRSIVFDRQGRIVSLAQREFTQHYPQPGWVEHDPQEIWQTQRDTMGEAIHRAGISARDVRAIGITNQRETTVVWDRRTGEPIHRAIVWQDRRAEPACAELRARGREPDILKRTGLRIDAYFSATKLKWILDHVPGARARAQAGELLFGTIDSWLIWNLTGGQRHLTDVSNAARTMLMDVHANAWDPDLLDWLDVPARMMPDIQPSSADYGASAPDLLGHAVPICGVAGDQQSALFGQACFHPGMAKNTYGTGCFMLMHTGERFQVSGNGLVTTSAAQPDLRPAYALEGSVFVGGAVVQWLRDGLRAFVHSSDIEALAGSVPDSGGVMFVPAFTGLGAPWWDPEARGTITGLTRGTSMAHIARAALESIAYQSAALLQAMSRDAQAAGAAPLKELRVDGGACVNDLLMQFQADLLGIPVLRPTMVETTALGVAFLAGLQAGVYADLQELASLWRVERRFEPAMSRDEANGRLAGWDHAIRQASAR